MLMSLNRESIDDALISSVSLLLRGMFPRRHFDPTPAQVLEAYTG